MITLRKTLHTLFLLAISMSAQASMIPIYDDNNSSDESQSGSYENDSYESDEPSEKIEEVQIIGSTWEEMKLKLEALMEETMTDQRYEKRAFAMDFTLKEQTKYIEWFCGECLEKYEYRKRIAIGGSSSRIAIGGSNREYKGPDPTINMTYILTITNYALAEARSRQSEAYEFYSMHKSSNGNKCNFLVDNMDLTKINEKTFHSLMVRAKLSAEETNRGAHDSAQQSPVDVLAITLKNIELDKAVQELIAVIDSFLLNSMKPVVVTVFNLAPNAQFLPDKLLSGWTQIFSKSSRFCSITRAITYENDERRLYLALNNDLRRVRDLHGLKPSEAKAKVVEFICGKYDSFQSDLQIMTGRGNHGNGFSILKESLPRWLEDDSVRDLILSHGPNDRNPGIYDVFLRKPISMLSPELNRAPPHVQHMLRCGAITAARPSLDGKGWILQYGEETEIKEENYIEVRLADEERYLKVKHKNKKANPRFKAVQQAVAPKGAPKAAKQQAAPKAAPKAAKQQAAQKAAPKAAKQQAVPKAAPKAVKQPAAPKAAPKAVKQQAAPKAVKQPAAPKAAPKAGKVGPAPKVEQKVAPKKQGGKK